MNVLLGRLTGMLLLPLGLGFGESQVVWHQGIRIGDLGGRSSQQGQVVR
ncbi:hypothetical protein QPX96_08620 [Limosilactobacillus fermentum]|nr:hypothetical protein [Limosilactobacillus fermentum]